MKKSIIFLTLIIILCASSCSKEKTNEGDFKFAKCIYTTENYVTGRVGHSIILGDKNFSPKSNLIHNESNNSLCLYFSLSESSLKKGMKNLSCVDGAFEGAIIDHGQEIEFKIDCPMECTYNGKKLHLKGTARLYEPGTSRKSGKTFSFTYDGPVTKGLFIDLWSNPSYQIKIH